MPNPQSLARVPDPDALATAHALEARIFAGAGAVDVAAAYPAADIAALSAAGMLHAPLAALDPATLGQLLATIGGASLTVGRLYEGHVNAAHLIRTYAPHVLPLLAAEAAAGRPGGVWNAEKPPGLTAVPAPGGWRLHGSKIHCSGAGSLRRPIVTARPQGADAPLMFLPDLASPHITIDLTVWRAAGMRGTATGTVHFDGLHVPAAAVIGEIGDYYRSPHFSGGAWRVLAVQVGSLARALALHAESLTASGRASDPIARARFAQCAGHHELARLLVAEAARRAGAPTAGPPEDAGAIDAYVDLARASFEDLALASITLTRRNIGLGSYIAPAPLDRVLRDLETYLRQPFLDASRDAAAGWLLPRAGHFHR